MRNSKVIAMLQAQLAQRDERIAELEDRLQAGSLAELRAFRPVAMPEPVPQQAGHWESDPTGIYTVFVPDELNPE